MKSTNRISKAVLTPLLTAVLIISINSGFAQWPQLGTSFYGTNIQNLGKRVDMSKNGSTVAIGLPNATVTPTTKVGIVQVYNWNGSVWNQVGSDLTGASFNDRFGWDIGLSGDGNVVAVGKPDYSNATGGECSVYEWDGTSWQQRGASIPGTTAGERCGKFIDLSEDGLILAAVSESSLAGRVRIYEWDGSNWSQRGSDILGTTAQRLGHDVKLDSAGNRVVLGASGGSEAHVYEWDGANWNQVGAAVTDALATNFYGRTVSISANGNTVVVGDESDDLISTNAGAAYVYDWDGANWNQRGSSQNGFANDANFGCEVDISSDGNRIVAGERGNDDIGADVGTAYVFEWDGAFWTQIFTNSYGDAAGDGFGDAVAMNGLGDRFIGGGWTSDIAANNAGMAKVYSDRCVANPSIEAINACSSYTWSANDSTYTSTGIYQALLTTAANCDSVAFIDLVIQQPTSGTEFQTACSSYNWPTNGNVYTASGIYQDTLTGSNGCDSIANLDLTINLPSLSVDTQSVCVSYTWPIDGNTYTASGLYQALFTGANGCDSTWILDLTVNQPTSGIEVQVACVSYTWPADGNTYTTSGIYQTILVGSNGCDSTAMIDLIINQPTSGQEMVSSCGDYTWAADGNTYSTSGIYQATLTGVNGCDSTATLDLTITTIDTSVSQLGDTLMANQGGGTYQWLDCDNGFMAIAGSTNQSHGVTADGNYAVMISQGGCTDTSGCHQVNISSIHEHNAPEMVIYPNPSVDHFTIDVDGYQGWLSIRILDMLGRTMDTWSGYYNQPLTLQAHLPQGTYLIEVGAEDWRRVLQAIRQ